jgi:hypothetical protein
MPTPQLTNALAQAQGAFKPIQRSKTVTVRTKEGQAYQFAYAPLDVVMAAVQEGLTANGLAISHRIQDGTLYSTLSHESGEERESIFPLRRRAGWPHASAGLRPDLCAALLRPPVAQPHLGG